MVIITVLGKLDDFPALVHRLYGPCEERLAAILGKDAFWFVIILTLHRP